MYKLLLSFIMSLWFSSSFAGTRLVCDVVYDYMLLGEKKSSHTRVNLSIDTRNGQYWKHDIDGQIKFFKKTHLVFDIHDSDVYLKFSAIPENDQSYFSDDSDDVVYKFSKKTIYKNGAEKLESFFLDRLTGKLDASYVSYIKVPGPVSQSTKVLGNCVKGATDLKF